MESHLSDACSSHWFLLMVTSHLLNLDETDLEVVFWMTVKIEQQWHTGVP